jgi:hypothetical protein
MIGHIAYIIPIIKNKKGTITMTSPQPIENPRFFPLHGLVSPEQGMSRHRGTEAQRKNQGRLGPQPVRLGLGDGGGAARKTFRVRAYPTLNES